MRVLTTHDLGAVVREFALSGEFLDGAPYGNGHINDTYAVRFRQGDETIRYVLQRINHGIFQDVPRLMENIQRVTDHLRAAFRRQPGNDARRETLTIIPARDGRSYWRDAAGNWWRMYVFIEQAQTVEVVQTPEQAYEAAKTFARFQKLLRDLPPPRLHDTIPDFHHTPKRFRALEQAIASDPRNRAAEGKPEIDFALAREPQTRVLVDLQHAGSLPERITHNDTKINNVLLDERDGRGVAVIDLDTVMPGLVLYDVGDQIRTSSCTGTEDETKLTQVSLRLELFDALVRGYLEEAREFITGQELDYLVFSGRLITFEIGIRFLTDYLNGDRYFKSHRPGHNLERARTQFARLRAMERAESEMEQTVARYRAG